MATAINRAPRLDEIKLETNIPQTFALKYSTGKAVGNWGNTMFTAIDERRMFLNDEDTGEFEHALLDLRYQPGDFIRVTRVKHGTVRGGGFAIRVERVEDEDGPEEPARRVQRSVALSPHKGGGQAAATPSRTEALLEKSVEMARNGEKFRTREAAPISPESKTASTPCHAQALPNGSPAITPASAKLLSAYMTAVDTLIEAQGYAQRKGLMLSVTCEDVRCLAATIFIDQKGGTR